MILVKNREFCRKVAKTDVKFCLSPKQLLISSNVCGKKSQILSIDRGKESEIFSNDHEKYCEFSKTIEKPQKQNTAILTIGRGKKSQSWAK